MKGSCNYRDHCYLMTFFYRLILLLGPNILICFWAFTKRIDYIIHKALYLHSVCIKLILKLIILRKCVAIPITKYELTWTLFDL
jgi:hypothetical protein